MYIEFIIVSIFIGVWELIDFVFVFVVEKKKRLKSYYYCKVILFEFGVKV